MSEPNYSILKRDGKVRTDLYCTECQKDFLATIDHSRDGNHTVYCPWCGHEHFRRVKGGVVTGDRWKSDGDTIKMSDVARVENGGVLTTSTCHFLKDRWLNRGEE